MSVLLSLSMPAKPAASQQSANSSADKIDALKSTLSETITNGSSGLEGIKMGIVVYDTQTQSKLFGLNDDETFNTASNAKIITAAAALSGLGSGFRMRTEALGGAPDEKGVVKGNLFIRGRGNPAFNEEDLLAMARDLENKGIKKFTGGIVVDQSYFDSNNLPPHFDEQPHEQASFRAPIAATAFNFNTFSLRITPALNGEGPAEVRVEPKNNYVVVKNEVKTVSRGRARIRVDTVEKSGRLEVRVSGKIRTTSPVRTMRRRAPDPSAYLRSVLKQELRRRGIRLGPAPSKSIQPPTDATLLAVHHSPPLAVLVRGMGKYSNNFVAEMILKTLGAETLAAGMPATWEDGVAAVHDFLERELGLKPDDYLYENGSGLFSSNSFSPNQMARVLTQASKNFRWGPDLIASLSISATDGTLSNRMFGTIAAEQVRAKTGTLAQASALSGFIAMKKPSPVVFSMLFNDVPRGQIDRARRLQDQIASTIARYLEHN